jgi:hypothetical protein
MDHPASMTGALARWAFAALLALLMAWVPDEAAAFGTVQKSQQPDCYSSGTDAPGCYPSAMDAALAAVSKVNPLYEYGHTANGSCTGGPTSYSCPIKYWEPQPSPFPPVQRTRTQGATRTPGTVSCPPDSLVSGSVCLCKPGFRIRAGSYSGDPDPCEAYTCEAGTLATVHSQQVGGMTLDGCVEGCKTRAQMVSQGSDGRYWTMGDHRETGETCEGGGGADSVPNVPPSPTNDGESGIPNTCTGANVCPVVLSDRTVCIPCTKSTQGDEGKTTETTTNPDGSTSTKTSTTECGVDKCTTTTTTTTKAPDGTTTGTITQTKDDPIGKYCQDNPKSPLCNAEEEKESSSFGGACSGGFSCKGDAVQCAMARQQHERNCQMFDTPTPISIIGENAADGQDRPPGHPLNGATADGSSLNFQAGISQADLLGGGGCPSDVSVSVGGRAYTIPWSQHCDKFQLIGNLMVGLCMMVAAFIVFRS